jgi:hypothetical protein
MKKSQICVSFKFICSKKRKTIFDILILLFIFLIVLHVFLKEDLNIVLDEDENVEPPKI